MLNDPLANALSKLLNAEKIGKREIEIKPSSKVIEKVFDILNEKGFLGSYESEDTTRARIVKVNLINKINNCSVIKPRYPVKYDNFEKYEKRYLPAKDFGLLIVSTSQGIMTQKEAIEKKIGGKLLAFVY